MRTITFHGQTQGSRLSQLASAISDDGIAFFADYSAPAFLVDMSTFGVIYAHPDSNVDGITAIKPTSTDPGLGFSREEIGLHTERATVESPPDLVSIFCVKQAGVGGASRLTDSKRALRFLRWAPQRITEFATTCKLRPLDGPLRPLLEVSQQRLKFRYRNDHIAAPTSSLSDDLAALEEQFEANALELTLRSGEGYVIDNRRWLHGRTDFLGDRSLQRILLDLPAENPVKLGFRAW